MSFTTVSRVESGLDQLLVQLDEVASPLQKIPSGIAEGLPLHGEELLEDWRARIGFSRFELKRMRVLVDTLELAPPQLADRLESLFRLQPDAAAEELGRLVGETRALVAAELPDLDLSLQFPPGTRQLSWSIPSVRRARRRPV